MSDEDGPNATDESDGSTDADENGVDTTDIPESAVTAAVQPDQAEFQEFQADLNERVQEGELDRQEAIQQSQEKERELLADATMEFENYADERDEFSVEDSLPETGAILIDGDADAILAALNDGEMNALLSGETFAMVQQQAQADVNAETGDAEDETGDSENETVEGNEDES